MKKIESPRDYYRALWKKARAFKVDLPAKQWCDLWHRHLDWDGKGNESWLDRRRHIAGLMHMLGRARRELAFYPKPYQVFATISPGSSGDDAVYVHTENPNGTPFPVVYEGAVPVSVLTAPLVGKISLAHYSVFSVGSGEDRHYVVFPRET